MEIKKLSPSPTNSYVTGILSGSAKKESAKCQASCPEIYLKKKTYENQFTILLICKSGLRSFEKLFSKEDELFKKCILKSPLLTDNQFFLNCFFFFFLSLGLFFLLIAQDSTAVE